MRIRSLIPTGDTLQIVCTSAPLASREGECECYSAPVYGRLRGWCDTFTFTFIGVTAAVSRDRLINAWKTDTLLKVGVAYYGTAYRYRFDTLIQRLPRAHARAAACALHDAEHSRYSTGTRSRSD